MPWRLCFLIPVCAFIAMHGAALTAQERVQALPDGATMARLEAGDTQPAAASRSGPLRQEEATLGVCLLLSALSWILRSWPASR